MKVLERLKYLDFYQARRFERLEEAAQEIAYKGIVRHFNACDNCGVAPDTGAIREIIDDAIDGRAVYAGDRPRGLRGK